MFAVRYGEAFQPKKLSARASEPEYTRRLSRNLPGVWPGMMGSNGFAVLPIAALDPPHRAASPAVPALDGSGSPDTMQISREGSGSECLVFCDLFKRG